MNGFAVIVQCSISKGGESMQSIKRKFLILLFTTWNLPAFCLVALASRIRKRMQLGKTYNVIWGTEPIINSHHWARATKKIFTTSVFVTRYDSFVLDGRADLILFTNHEMSHPLRRLARSFSENLIFFMMFSRALLTANIVCMSCDGFIFQHYKIMGFNHRVEFYLLKLAGVKVCILPYGGDAYVYSRIQDKNWLFGLMSDYPSASKHQRAISKRVDFYVRQSDIFLPGQMLFDGLGRSDWITPSTLCLQVPDKVGESKIPSDSFIVTHAPNHRAVKGTSFVISAIEELKGRGVDIELRLLEKMPNKEVIRVLSEESDLHIDQLFFDGYGLNALESMALGVPTIGNFSGPYRNFFDRWSHTAECPIIIANEHTLSNLLSKILADRSILKTISHDSIEYVRRFHSDSAFSDNFLKIVEKVDPRYRRWLDEMII